MFKFSELKSIHLEISTRCQASCPMCPRKYHGGVENPNLKIADWTLDEFKAIFTKEVLDQVELIYFCGNFGDPIMNDDLVEMCRFIKENTLENVHVRIHTNGGARSKKWWQDLYHALPKNHMVYFGIDGLEDTNHLYRIGVKYESTINNAKTFIEEGGKAEWVFIKFRHNEHQELEAERRSKEIGFVSFTVKNTTRFIGDTKYSVVDKEGNVLYYLEPPSTNTMNFITKEQMLKAQDYVDEATIHCYVLDTKEIYIDAHKHVFPCCFLSSAPYHYKPQTVENDEYKKAAYNLSQKILSQYYELVESLGGIENISALNRPVKDIIDNNSWQNIWDYYWNDNKLLTCVRVCGKTETSKPKDQFVKRVANA